MQRFINLLEGLQDKLAGRDMVLQLCKEDVSDYERGMIQGQIDMLTKIMLELSNEES